MSVANNLVSKTWTQALVAPQQIPPAADVVIIGGGIVGVSTAWFLAKQGVNVVLRAAGAWTSMFCRSLGITVPQLKVRGTVARTAPAENVLDGNMYDKHIALRRREDGGYTVAHGTILDHPIIRSSDHPIIRSSDHPIIRSSDHPITPSTFRFGFKYIPALMMEIKNLRLTIGREFVEEWSAPKTWALDLESPFERTRVLNPQPSKSVLRGIRRNLDKVFPQLASAELVESWAGMIETTPDVIPVIDEAGTLPGFYIATGFSGHGFGIGPGAGKAIAGMLTGNDVGIPLDEFRLSRFFDGTKLQLQSSV